MKLKEFKIERFRSIGSASLKFHDLTVLVGPNNEGKSNILRAMVLGMDALRGFAIRRPNIQVSRKGSRVRRLGRSLYDWERDFSQHHRNKSETTTRLEYEFTLDNREIEEFANRIGSRINGNLRVRLTFGRDSQVTFSVIKQKVGGKLSERAEDIARFVGSRIRVEYVSSLRTAEESTRIVAELVEEELYDVDDDKEYQEALEVIRKAQQLKLNEIGRSVHDTLQEFLPNVNSVEVQFEEATPSVVGGQSVTIYVDDGYPTSLQTKGDGVQSLAAIALIRRAVSDRYTNRTFVLAVEEPEAHLHPLAIRELKKVLFQIAHEQQVVVTTHNPLLVDPLRIQRNIIVEGNRARVAKNVREVRDCLGIRLEDNLQSARLVLIVEGQTDKRIFQALLTSHSDRLSDFIDQGSLIIEGLRGAGGLSSRLAHYATGVCGRYVVLDGDKAGKQAIEEAINERLLEEDDYLLVHAPGKKEAEIEDLINPEIYLDDLGDYFGLKLTKREVVGGKGKWSDRVGRLVEARGKLWNQKNKQQAKAIVARAVEGAPETAFVNNNSLMSDVTDRLSRMLRKP